MSDSKSGLGIRHVVKEPILIIAIGVPQLQRTFERSMDFVTLYKTLKMLSDW